MAEHRSEVVFTGHHVRIGAFRCPVDSPLWQTENVTGNFPMLVFPRTSVGITQSRRTSVVASPNHVMFYNARQVYHRKVIGTRGDVCEYFYVHPETIEEAFRSIGGNVPDEFEAPFEFSHGPCSTKTYFLQRCIFNSVQTESDVDSLLVEELFLDALPDILLAALDFNDPFARRRNVDEDKKVHCEKVDAAKEFIGANFHRPIRLYDIASSAGCSVFHLSRIFSRIAGMSLHNYLFQLRIRHTLADVIESRRPLTDVALDYGFCSHSHFTNSFRRVFGVAPSFVRKHDASLIRQFKSQ